MVFLLNSLLEALPYLNGLLASGLLGAYLVFRLMPQRVAQKRTITQTGESRNPEVVQKITDRGELDPRRKWAIVTAGATDHAGEVCVVPGKQDLSQTIFKDLTGLASTVMKGSVCIDLYWSESALKRISDSFSILPRAPDHNQCILDFMENECNFKVEHADGSFMDHLQFCFEYGHSHFKQHSPRVLFLHSIMGVGTNIFPMDVEKVPKLRGMLTDDEFLHIQAFPSMLRLLYSYDLLANLSRNLEHLDKLKSIKFHRVIDNKEITLTADQLWVQLNYQICHQLDFLPVSNWIALQSNAFMNVFLDLYTFLQASKKLEAEIKFDWTSAEKTNAGLPVTLGGVITQLVPRGVVKKLGAKQMAKNSNLIGHSLNYSLNWVDNFPAVGCRERER